MIVWPLNVSIVLLSSWIRVSPSHTSTCPVLVLRWTCSSYQRPVLTVVALVRSVPHEEIPARIAGAHVVCQPSLIEPFGQAVLEAMACGRSVLATSIGGPPEFVPPEAGVLVDPLDLDALAHGLRAAAALPCPNTAAREAAERHDVREQARRVEEVLERAAAESG